MRQKLPSIFGTEINTEEINSPLPCLLSTLTAFWNNYLISISTFSLRSLETQFCGKTVCIGGILPNSMFSPDIVFKVLLSEVINFQLESCSESWPALKFCTLELK